MTNQIRIDNIRYNEDRIEKGKDENEIWKVVSDITKPNADHTWNMKTEEGNTNDEQEISNTFNTFFTEKITKLKDKIDKDIMVDPLEKLKEKMSTKKLRFEIKTITKEVVKKAFTKIKKKKSSGCDGLSQQHLAMGSESLAKPLM